MEDSDHFVDVLYVDLQLVGLKQRSMHSKTSRVASTRERFKRSLGR